MRERTLAKMGTGDEKRCQAKTKHERRETGETEDTEAVRAKTSLKMSEEHGVPEIDSRLETRFWK